VCPRKEKPFPDTDGARKHEQRTGHTCLPTECKQWLEQDRQASSLRLVQAEIGKQVDQQIRFSSLIRDNRKPSNIVSKAERTRRQKEAENLLLRVFSCNTMEEALGHLFRGRDHRASLINYLETEKSTLAGLVEKHSAERG
jgi:hypothetical protein